MRLGIVSDIHGNVEAMRRAVREMDGEVDELLVAGDAFSDHQFSNDVVREIRSARARYVLGNHELSLLSPAGVNARTSKRVDADDLAFVSEQPMQVRTRVGGKTLLMVHGSPWEPYGDYLSPTNPKFQRCDELDADFVITGHTHLAFAARFGRTLVVNPGSLGRSDDPERRDTVTYAIIDTESDHVEVREFANPMFA